MILVKKYYYSTRDVDASKRQVKPLYSKLIMRSRAGAARKAHNLEVSGSIPLSATKKNNYSK